MIVLESTVGVALLIPTLNQVRRGVLLLSVAAIAGALASALAIFVEAPDRPPCRCLGPIRLSPAAEVFALGVLLALGGAAIGGPERKAQAPTK